MLEWFAVNHQAELINKNLKQDIQVSGLVCRLVLLHQAVLSSDCISISQQGLESIFSLRARNQHGSVRPLMGN